MSETDLPKAFLDFEQSKAYDGFSEVTYYGLWSSSKSRQRFSFAINTDL